MSLVSEDSSCGLFAATQGYHLIYIRIDRNDSLWLRQLEPSELISAEVTADEGSITKTARSGLARAIIGGAVAGPAGMIVGAVTGGSSSATRSAPMRVDFELTVSDPLVPLLRINLMKSDAPNEAGGKAAIALGREWVARIRAIMDASEVKYIAPASNIDQLSPPHLSAQAAFMQRNHITDDLQRLQAMRESGSLTEEEFMHAKRKVLNL